MNINTSFKEWVVLKEQQRMLFSKGPRMLYHGSNTGKGDLNLKKFKENGVNSQLSSGHGQGSGFYVWSDKESAITHANKILTDPNMITNASQDGLPMIVTIEAILEPESWELDYELNKKPLIQWLHNNWEKVKNSLTSVLNVDKTKRIDNPAKVSPIAGRGEIPAQKGFRFNPYGERKRKSMMMGSSGGSAGEGELLGSIFRELRGGQNKNLVHRFEEIFFANLPPWTAIKYVGSQTLPTKTIEVFQNGQWSVA